MAVCVQGQTTLNTGFESGGPNFGFPTVVGHIDQSTTFARLGSNSVYVQVIKGEPMIAAGARSEMNLTEIPQSYPTEQWFGMSYYIPVAWVNDAANITDILAQWHSDGGGPPIAFGIDVGSWYVQTASGNGITFQSSILHLASVTKGAWTDIAFHIVWSTTTTGSCDIYINGSLIKSYASVKTYPTGQAAGPFFKLGCYKWPWNTGSGELNGAGSVTSVRQLYIDEVHVVTGSGHVLADVSPASATTPTANAGSNQSINLPSKAQLAGSATGSVSTYSWTTISGPGTVTYSNTGIPTPTAQFSVAGTYVLQLQVQPGGSTSTVTITVALHTAPLVNAGTDQTITNPASLTLNPTETTYQGASVTSRLWLQVSGPNTATLSSPTVKNPVVSGLVAGTYVFSYQVHDSYLGVSNVDQVTIVVTDAALPVANAGSNLSANGTTATLDGSHSVGPVTSFSWVKTSGPGSPVITNPTSAITTVTGLAVGTYVFTLTVNDAGGTHPDASTVTLTVINNGCNCGPNGNALNFPNGTAGIFTKPGPYFDPEQEFPLLDTIGGRCSNPTVTTGGNPSTTLPNGTVTVSCTAKGNNGGAIVSYSWLQIGTGPTGTIASGNAATTTLTFKAPGTATFQVTATDACGYSASNTVNVTVNPAVVVVPPGTTVTKETPIYKTVWWFFKQLTGVTLTYSNGKSVTVTGIKSYSSISNGKVVVVFTNGKSQAYP